jgi:hypothetical protein
MHARPRIQMRGWNTDTARDLISESTSIPLSAKSSSRYNRNPEALPYISKLLGHPPAAAGFLNNGLSTT